MKLPAIIKVGYAKNLLRRVLNETFYHYQDELSDFEKSCSVEQLDELISLKNEGTNKGAKELIASGIMEGCSLGQRYGIYRRMYNCLELLNYHDDRHLLILMNDENQVYSDPLEFFLLGLELSSGLRKPLLVSEEEDPEALLKRVFPNYVSFSG